MFTWKNAKYLPKIQSTFFLDYYVRCLGISCTYKLRRNKFRSHFKISCFDILLTLCKSFFIFIYNISMFLEQEVGGVSLSPQHPGLLSPWASYTTQLVRALNCRGHVLKSFEAWCVSQLQLNPFTIIVIQSP